MKLFYLSTAVIPSQFANSIHVMKMCRAFASNGHNVQLLIPDKANEREIGIDDIYAYYDVNPCFEIKRFSWLPIIGKAYLYGLFIANYVKKHSPDLVYSRDIISAYFISRQGIPVVYESHSPITNSGPIAAWMFNRLIHQKGFSYLVVITQSLKCWYLSNYKHLSDKVSVIADGADLPTDLQYKRARACIDQDIEKFQIGYVGNLYPGKGMEIISKLVALCSEMEFHIVGGHKEDIEYWRHHLRNYPNIRFHGYRPHSDVFNIMKQMDVLLAPNLRTVKLPGKNSHDIGSWTSPLKIFEYMAAYKPIVASDIEVLHEVLEDQRNSLLCDPDNINAWRSAICKLKENPNLSQMLSQNAFNDLKNKYNWKARAQRALSLESAQA